MHKDLDVLSRRKKPTEPFDSFLQAIITELGNPCEQELKMCYVNLCYEYLSSSHTNSSDSLEVFKLKSILNNILEVALSENVSFECKGKICAVLSLNDTVGALLRQSFCSLVVKFYLFNELNGDLELFLDSLDFNVLFDGLLELLQSPIDFHMKRKLGLRLSMELQKYRGLIKFIQYFVSCKDGHYEDIQGQLILLLLAIPREIDKKNYFSSILSQLKELISSESIDQNIVKIASFCLVEMLEKYPKIVQFHVLDDVIKPFQSISMNNDKEVVVEESIVESCLLQIRNLLVLGKPSFLLISSLSCISNSFYSAYNQLKNSICFSKRFIADILETIFRLSNESDIAKSLFLYCNSLLLNENSSLGFKSGECGGICIGAIDLTITAELVCEYMTQLLTLSSNENIKCDFVIFLLHHYNSIEQEENDEYRLMFSRFVLLILPSVQESIMKCHEKMFPFVKELLSNDKEEELLIMGLSLLSVLVDEEELEAISARLLELKSHSNVEVAQLSKELSMRSNRNSCHSDSSIKLEIEAALRDMDDPLIPTQAFGMVQIKQLITSKKEGIEDFLTISLEAFLLKLHHEDSYIYLHAIKCISTMSSAYPDIFIPKICSLFQSEIPIEVRFRLGECLLQIIQRQGQAIAIHAAIVIPSLLNTFFKGNYEIQSSILGIISVYLETDPLSSLPYLSEILAICSNNLPCNEVHLQRGALTVLKFLLVGSSNMIFEMAEMERLAQLYKKVKVIEADAFADEVSRFHSKQILSLLSSIIHNKEA